MRGLKFRAWDKLDKEFAHNIDCLLDISVAERVFALDDEGGELIIEQYTGLKDKKGKEIYEGDILRFKSGPKSVVKFCEIKDSDCTYFYLGWASVQDGYEPMSLCEEAGFCEVIGNIHENPELLEGRL